MRFPREKSWQAKPRIGTRAQGAFTEEEIKTPGLSYRNHAIHVYNDGTAGLALDGQRIDGFFIAFEGGDLLVYRDTTKGQFARNGTDAVISPGLRVVGAEKDITGKPLGGYVRPANLTVDTSGTLTAAEVQAVVTELERAVNNVVRGPAGVAHGASVYPPADVVVEIGIASSD